MSRISIFCLCGALAAAGIDPSTGAPPPEPSSERLLGHAFVDSRAYDRLAHLVDRFGPRLSGFPNLDAAIAWAAEEMRGDGLDRVWTEKVSVPHWVRGEERGEIVAPARHPLALTALGGSIPTPAAGTMAEVVEATSFADLKALGDRVRGRIVLFNRPIVRNGEGEQGYGNASALRSKGASEAAKLGAVAMLVRSLGTASFRLPHTGAMHYEDGVAQIPAAAVAAEDADLIHRLLAAGEPVTVRLVLGCQTLPDADSANVLAEVRGRDRPDEIVLIGAHLDSWDLGTGAIDDGAGVAIVMETMRLLKAQGASPRRTVRAVLFTNEENGLRGGKAYAAARPDEIARHVAAIESDSGAAHPLGFSVSAGPGGEELVRQIASALAGIGADRVKADGGGADISPLKQAGVPVLSLNQDWTFYFDYHHTAADTLDKVDPQALALNVGALLVMTYRLADLPESLPRLAPEPPKP